VHAFIAPILLGNGKSPFMGRGADKISDALRLVDWSVQQIENDFLLQGRTQK